jgi:hypothetical protein
LKTEHQTVSTPIFTVNITDTRSHLLNFFNLPLPPYRQKPVSSELESFRTPVFTGVTIGGTLARGSRYYNILNDNEIDFYLFFTHTGFTILQKRYQIAVFMQVGRILAERVEPLTQGNFN